MLKPEYRIVRDYYCGYEVQIRRWWHWPIWLAVGCNTYSSIEMATKFAEGHSRKMVKYLGRLGEQ